MREAPREQNLPKQNHSGHVEQKAADDLVNGKIISTSLRSSGCSLSVAST